jgi:hypothetical protein
MNENNLSRKKAKEFAQRLGWQQQGRGNFFITNSGELVNITLCNGVEESRQFRADCQYLITLREDSDLVKIYPREQLTIKGVSRIGPDGTKYYQANVKQPSL